MADGKPLCFIYFIFSKTFSHYDRHARGCRNHLYRFYYDSPVTHLFTCSLSHFMCDVVCVSHAVSLTTQLLMKSCSTKTMSPYHCQSQDSLRDFVSMKEDSNVSLCHFSLRLPHSDKKKNDLTIIKILYLPIHFLLIN